MLDVRRMKVLREVATRGSFSAAAEALSFTQSAVSQQIAALERETGVALLDRSRLGGRRRSSLTPAGRLLAAHAGRLVTVLGDAERELAELTGRVAGRVTVGAFTTVVAHLLAPAAAALLRTSPDVQVRVVEVSDGRGRGALRAGELDVLLTEADDADDAPPAPDLVARHLLDDPYWVVVPAAWDPVEAVAPLLRRPWVASPPGTAARRILDRIAVQHDAGPLDLRHECLEFPAALGLVTAGLGAAVVPALALPHPLPPQLRVLPAPGAAGRRIAALHRAGRGGAGPATRLVLEALTTQALDLAAAPAERP
jgi:DNA-binding transcriptional LysR family regulator